MRNMVVTWGGGVDIQIQNIGGIKIICSSCLIHSNVSNIAPRQITQSDKILSTKLDIFHNPTQFLKFGMGLPCMLCTFQLDQAQILTHLWHVQMSIF